MSSAVTDAPIVAADAILVSGISKHYGRAQALSDVTFAVPANGVTALLGLNGAGKTTLFQILTGLFVADAGQVSVFGDDLARAPVRALSHMGLVFQSQVLDLDLSVRQNLDFYAGLHGLRGPAARAAIKSGLARFSIADLANTRVRDLSGGTRRKVELARALVTTPRLLLLDEPSQGLDTQSRAELVRDLFALCEDDGTTVLWATHLVGEVQRANHVVVLHGGRVAAQGRPDDLAASVGVDTLEAAFLAIVRGEKKPQEAA